MRKCLVLLALLLVGCGEQDVKQESDSGVRDVIANVNDVPITAQELEHVMLKTFGEYAAMQLGDEGRKKLLESMIIKKLMAEQQLAQLSEYELTEFKLAQQAYRDEYLSKRYIQQNITATPVSEEQVQAYYNANLSEFGQKVQRRFEMITLPNSKAAQNALDSFIKDIDWRVHAQDQKDKGTALILSLGTQGDKGLSPFYRNIIANVALGEVSKTYRLDNKLIRFKVIAEHKSDAKPLSEVKEQIRKTLSPIQIKRAIKEEAARLKQQAKITRYAMD
ncbi:peptidyl-prolyl cis-trans isomerase [Pseudoalteromonas sp. XMcav1-K]|uniref:peptidylprolyl isomerase n=1 Tax=Pseudoalteromonas sp. XMcav1-K TaxID=3374372 RepID=UPI0037579FC0